MCQVCSSCFLLLKLHLCASASFYSRSFAAQTASIRMGIFLKMHLSISACFRICIFLGKYISGHGRIFSQFASYTHVSAHFRSFPRESAAVSIRPHLPTPVRNGPQQFASVHVSTCPHVVQLHLSHSSQYKCLVALSCTR